MGDWGKRRGIRWGFEEEEEEEGKQGERESSGSEAVGKREGHAMCDSHRAFL